MPLSSQSLITEGIRISVQSMFVPEQSSANNNCYVFAYRINISNESNHTVKLLRRHWIITDGYGEKRIVEGDGVVGQQPVLSPGQVHTYVSGSVFKTPVGKMEGYYTMQKDSSEIIDVVIPTFYLISPSILN
ncbi:MAG: Co2+/Mg2+ efflux protein ApaG [Bacteroidia bacterium]|nr:Co2+/Mg2+ efflux protein ApaG [Bacteroidia bacterium]